jgi:hypothetical protein
VSRACVFVNAGLHVFNLPGLGKPGPARVSWCLHLVCSASGCMLVHAR